MTHRGSYACFFDELLIAHCESFVYNVTRGYVHAAHCPCESKKYIPDSVDQEEGIRPRDGCQETGRGEKDSRGGNEPTLKISLNPY